MSRRRRTPLGLRCWQGVAPFLAMAAVAFVVDGAWRLGAWLVAR